MVQVRMLSDNWLSRYIKKKKTLTKWNGNGNTYDRGDYNSSFALISGCQNIDF